jgi:REP element-mobilizing transposase RayT
MRASRPQSRGHPARAGSRIEERRMAKDYSWKTLSIRHRGRTPHWDAEGATYAVSFRLGDSLPHALLEAYRQERADIVALAESVQRELTRDERDRLDHLYSERIESYLDQGAGACLLGKPGIAENVKNSLEFFHNQRYRLFVWCVMPNHVHTVFRPLTGFTLSDILHSWKSYTAKECNRLLNRRGEFWMEEYYDHLIRDEEDFANQCAYALANPQQARLDDWNWVRDMRV